MDSVFVSSNLSGVNPLPKQKNKGSLKKETLHLCLWPNKWINLKPNVLLLD